MTFITTSMLYLGYGWIVRHSAETMCYYFGGDVEVWTYVGKVTNSFAFFVDIPEHYVFN